MAALYLAPTLHSGLTDSDLLISHVGALGPADGVSAWESLQQCLNRFNSVDGGFTPLRGIPLAAWFLASSLPVARALQYALILANVATYSYFIERLFRSRAAALLATAFTLIVWQLRLPHDPTLGTSFQWPWNTELIFLSALGILEYNDRRHFIWLLTSIGSAAVAAASSTAVVPVVALLAIFAYASMKRVQGLVIALAFLGLATLFLFANATKKPEHAVNWDGEIYVRTVATQTIAALPTIYRSFGNVAHDGRSDNSGDTRFDAIPDVTIEGWLAILSLALAVFGGLKAIYSETVTDNTASVLAIAAAFWLGPAFGLGPPAYWRGGLPLGQSYESVYLEQFGAGLLAAWLVIRLARSSGPRSELVTLGVTLFVLLIAFGNIRANSFTIDELGRHDLSRALVERAGTDGFFSSIPVGSTIVLPPDSRLYDEVYGSPADAKIALYNYSGRLFKTVAPLFERVGDSQCSVIGNIKCLPTVTNEFILQTARASLFFPQVSLSHWAATRFREPISDFGHGFAAFPDALAAQDAATLLKSTQPGVRYDVNYANESRALAYTVERTCGAVPFRELFSAAIPTVEWGSGFFPPPETGATPFYESGDVPFRGKVPLFRWASSPATLVVRRTQCTPHDLQVNFTVVTSEPAAVMVSWPGGNEIVRAGAHIRTPVTIQIKRTVRSPILINVATVARQFPEEHMLVRKNGDAPQDRRMLVLIPAVGEVLDSPLNPELDPNGGLQ